MATAASREERQAAVVRTLGAILCTLLLSGFFAPRCGAVVYRSDGSEGSLRALHNAARDWDTITLPAGTFRWTSHLDIKKGITLQGATAIVGPSWSPRVTDATIIRDDTPRSGPGAGIIKVTIGPSQLFRLSGITFSPGSSTKYASSNGAIHFDSTDASSNTSMRIDHCHFDHLYQGKLIWVSGWVYGVADHNVMDCRGVTTSFYFWHNSYGGTNQINGNGAWADYPWYGTNKFFFVEDNRVNGSGNNVLSGGTDSDHGARCVFRHNYFHNAGLNSHGTEGGAIRGVRCYEVYNNVFDWTIEPAATGQRSGGSLWHDNTWTGVENRNNRHTGLSQFREFGAVTARAEFRPAAVSPWDMNDTEGNGTYIEGHLPYLFDSGTDTSSINSKGVIHDSTKNWAPNIGQDYGGRLMAAWLSK